MKRVIIGLVLVAVAVVVVVVVKSTRHSALKQNTTQQTCQTYRAIVVAFNSSPPTWGDFRPVVEDLNVEATWATPAVLKASKSLLAATKAADGHLLTTAFTSMNAACSASGA